MLLSCFPFYRNSKHRFFADAQNDREIGIVILRSQRRRRIYVGPAFVVASFMRRISKPLDKSSNYINKKSGKNLFTEGLMKIGAAGEDPLVKEDHFVRFQEL
jgi:hypothetical protein